MYIADSYNHCIRKVTVSTGIITTYAGTGTASFSGDNGNAASATLYYPTDIAFDSSGISLYVSGCFLSKTYFNILSLGNMYIVDYGNHRIRKITVSTGIITTIAGNGGTGTYSGDGGQATAASLNYPFGDALDSAGAYLLCYSLFLSWFYLLFFLTRQRIHC